jgi:hypothetical protein
MAVFHVSIADHKGESLLELSNIRADSIYHVLRVLSFDCKEEMLEAGKLTISLETLYAAEQSPD